MILGARHRTPDIVREWRNTHPDQAIPDQLMPTQPWPAKDSEKAHGIPNRVIHYQYRHERARKTLRGIDDQVTKAHRAVDGHAPVKRNRYIQLTGAHMLAQLTCGRKSSNPMPSAYRGMHGTATSVSL